MKKTITTIALVTAVLGSAPTSAIAQTSIDEDTLGFGKEFSGWYVRASGMLVMQEDSKVTDNIGNIFNPGGGIIVNSAEASFEDSLGLSFAIGRDFEDSPLSVELEFTLRATDIDSFSLTGTIAGVPTSASGSAAGDVSVNSIMFNGIYNIDFEVSRWGAYAGAGIGLAQSEGELTLTDPGFGTYTFPQDDDITFAWQLMLGVTYQLSDQTQLYGGVRYFDAGDIEFEQFSGENASVNLEFGVRFSF